MGNMYVLTIIDLFSGWPEAAGIPDKKAETGSHFPKNVFVSAFLSIGSSLRQG